MASWIVDASPVEAVDGAWPLARSVRCPAAGQAPLGVAIVVYGRHGGASAFGHASLRVTWCEDGALRDTELEAYRLGAWNQARLEEEHAGEPWLDHEWLRSQRGALVLFRDEHPVDAGWYRDAMDDNREIYELWLDLTPDRALGVVRDLQAWLAEQQATFERHGALGPRYLPWSRNCTTVLRRLLPELDPGSALPFAWLRAVQDEALLLVLHPSASVARRWVGRDGALPTEAPRPHPVLRGGRRWPAEATPWEPVGPWTLAR